MGAAARVTQAAHHSQRCWCSQGLQCTVDQRTHRLEQSTDQKAPNATGFVNREPVNHLHDQKNIFSRETKDHSFPEAWPWEHAEGWLRCARWASCLVPCTRVACPMEKPHHAGPQRRSPGGTGPAAAPGLPKAVRLSSAPVQTGLHRPRPPSPPWQSPACLDTGARSHGQGQSPSGLNIRRGGPPAPDPLTQGTLHGVPTKGELCPRDKSPHPTTTPDRHVALGDTSVAQGPWNPETLEAVDSGGSPKKIFEQNQHPVLSSGTLLKGSPGLQKAAETSLQGQGTQHSNPGQPSPGNEAYQQ